MSLKANEKLMHISKNASYIYSAFSFLHKKNQSNVILSSFRVFRFTLVAKQNKNVSF
jgi:hypothetical protein